MKAKLLLIAFLLLATTAFAKKDKEVDRGTWVLTTTEIRDGVMGKDPYGVWTLTQNSATCEYARITWSDPPDKIPVGKEHEVVAIPYSYVNYRNYGPNDSWDWGFWGYMSIEDESGKTHEGTSLSMLWSLYSDDDVLRADGSLFTNDQVTLQNGAKLIVATCPFTKGDDTYMHYSKSLAYIYTYTPPGKLTEVDIIPEDRPGEDKGTDIPWEYIVPIAAVVGAGAIAIAKGGKGKNDPKGQKKEEKKKEEEEEKKPSTFKMILYKDFGDTLTANEPPKTVGARIEEITPEGQRIERPDLTAKIYITAESNCEVRDVRMSGKYKSGGVVATVEPPKDKIGEAKVRMVFTGPSGTLISHVVFKVKGAPKIVIDEALTFEAEGGNTQYIEFGISNFQGGHVEGVKVSIDEEGSQFFTSKLEPNETNPLKFRINFTEKGKLEEPQAFPAQEGAETKIKEKHLAGDIDCYTCTVTANLEGREEPVKATFNLYRIYLGVRLDVYPLKGYLVDVDSTYEKETLATDPKKQKKWGESRVSFKLFAADNKTGKIDSVVPDMEPEFVFEDVKDDSLIFVDRMGTKITEPVRLANFKFEKQDVDTDNTVIGILHSGGGGLYPPNRAKAKVTVKVTYQGKTYDASEIVPVISQPIRVIDDEVAYSQALKEDERKINQLIDLRYKIRCDTRFAELMPFYYKVDALIESYDAKFGVYEPDYEKLMRIFKKYCSGEIGSYFVNDSVWKPEWTEADENFNAFMATFSKMEYSIPGIAARIALGFFTAGASELVIAPYSGLSKIQKYYAKGGDNAYKAFVIGCADVLFWEGVFYVGGKAIQYAKETGLNNQMKEGFVQIKKAITALKKSKEGAKQLGKAEGFSTKALGEKVAEAGKKVVSTKKASLSKANEAIRKTRQMGDAVFTQRSKLMEECAIEARKDARKIVDKFKEVMNNPTATEEEIRRATLALQGNKSAQDLLKMSQSDLLRANFNSQMQKIYKEVDDITIKKLAKRLGVDPKDVKPWNEASGNASSDLFKGKKIGADRDVTYQVRGKDGKWVDIQEDIMEQAYCEAFNEYHYGFMPADRQQALKTLKKFDQAVVNGETGLESYGKDLQNIINPNFQTAKLYDPERVAKTFEHKCFEFINQGNKIKDQAEQLFKMGMEEEAKHVMGYGEKLIEEGIRQNVKQFKRILDPRIQTILTKGVKGKDYSLLYQKINVLESIGIPPPKDILPATLEEVRLTLQTTYHTTIEEVVKECSSVIKEVNALLP